MAMMGAGCLKEVKMLPPAQDKTTTFLSSQSDRTYTSLTVYDFFMICLRCSIECNVFNFFHPVIEKNRCDV